MYFYIRVIALIFAISRLHQDTHTYRLSIFLKIIRHNKTSFRRQQQRSEIMKDQPASVKQFWKNFFFFKTPSNPGNPRQLKEAAHSTDSKNSVNYFSKDF